MSKTNQEVWNSLPRNSFELTLADHYAEIGDTGALQALADRIRRKEVTPPTKPFDPR